MEGPKPFFATLIYCNIGKILPHNFSVAVKEWNTKLYLSDRSFASLRRSFGTGGRLAGLPVQVVGRAKEILATLENGDSAPLPSSEVSSVEKSFTVQKELTVESEQAMEKGRGKRKKEKRDSSQLELF